MDLVAFGLPNAKRVLKADGIPDPDFILGVVDEDYQKNIIDACSAVEKIRCLNWATYASYWIKEVKIENPTLIVLHGFKKLEDLLPLRDNLKFLNLTPGEILKLQQSLTSRPSERVIPPYKGELQMYDGDLAKCFDTFKGPQFQQFLDKLTKDFGCNSIRDIGYLTPEQFQELADLVPKLKKKNFLLFEERMRKWIYALGDKEDAAYLAINNYEISTLTNHQDILSLGLSLSTACFCHKNGSTFAASTAGSTATATPASPNTPANEAPPNDGPTGTMTSNPSDSSNVASTGTKDSPPNDGPTATATPVSPNTPANETPPNDGPTGIMTSNSSDSSNIASTGTKDSPPNDGPTATATPAPPNTPANETHPNDAPTGTMTSNSSDSSNIASTGTKDSPPNDGPTATATPASPNTPANETPPNDAPTATMTSNSSDSSNAASTGTKETPEGDMDVDERAASGVNSPSATQNAEITGVSLTDKNEDSGSTVQGDSEQKDTNTTVCVSYEDLATNAFNQERAPIVLKTEYITQELNHQPTEPPSAPPSLPPLRRPRISLAHLEPPKYEIKPIDIPGKFSILWDTPTASVSSGELATHPDHDPHPLLDASGLTLKKVRKIFKDRNAPRFTFTFKKESFLDICLQIDGELSPDHNICILGQLAESFDIILPRDSGNYDEETKIFKYRISCSSSNFVGNRLKLWVLKVDGKMRQVLSHSEFTFDGKDKQCFLVYFNLESKNIPALVTKEDMTKPTQIVSADVGYRFVLASIRKFIPVDAERCIILLKELNLYKDANIFGLLLFLLDSKKDWMHIQSKILRINRVVPVHLVTGEIIPEIFSPLQLKFIEYLRFLQGKYTITDDAELSNYFHMYLALLVRCDGEPLEPFVLINKLASTDLRVKYTMNEELYNRIQPRNTDLVPKSCEVIRDVLNYDSDIAYLDSGISIHRIIPACYMLEGEFTLIGTILECLSEKNLTPNSVLNNINRSVLTSVRDASNKKIPSIDLLACISSLGLQKWSNLKMNLTEEVITAAGKLLETDLLIKLLVFLSHNQALLSFKVLTELCEVKSRLFVPSEGLKEIWNDSCTKSTAVYPIVALCRILCETPSTTVNISNRIPRIVGLVNSKRWHSTSDINMVISLYEDLYRSTEGFYSGTEIADGFEKLIKTVPPDTLIGALSDDTFFKCGVMRSPAKKAVVEILGSAPDLNKRLHTMKLCCDHLRSPRNDCHSLMSEIFSENLSQIEAPRSCHDFVQRYELYYMSVIKICKNVPTAHQNEIVESYLSGCSNYAEQVVGSLLNETITPSLWSAINASRSFCNDYLQAHGPAFQKIGDVIKSTKGLLKEWKELVDKIRVDRWKVGYDITRFRTETSSFLANFESTPFKDIKSLSTIPSPVKYKVVIEIPESNKLFAAFYAEFFAYSKLSVAKPFVNKATFATECVANWLEPMVSCLQKLLIRISNLDIDVILYEEWIQYGVDIMDDFIKIVSSCESCWTSLIDSIPVNIPELYAEYRTFSLHAQTIQTILNSISAIKVMDLSPDAMETNSIIEKWKGLYYKRLEGSSAVLLPPRSSLTLSIVQADKKPWMKELNTLQLQVIEAEKVESVRGVIEFFDQLHTENQGNIIDLLNFCRDRLDETDKERRDLIEKAREVYAVLSSILEYKASDDKSLVRMFRAWSSIVQLSNTPKLVFGTEELKTLGDLLRGVFNAEAKIAMENMKIITTECSFLIEMNNANSKLGPLTIKRKEDQKKEKLSIQNIDQLRRLYEKVNLIISAGTKFNKSEDTGNKEAEVFIGVLGPLFEYIDILKEMKNDGHPNFQDFSEELMGSMEPGAIESKIKDTKAMKEEWIEHMKDIRGLYTTINTYTNQQILKLHNAKFPFDIPESDKDFLNLIKLLSPNKSEKDIIELVRKCKVDDSPETFVEFHHAIGSQLDKVFLDVDSVETIPNQRIEELSTQEPNVFMIEKHDDIWAKTFSIYFEFQNRLPIYEEILECSLQTTKGNIDTFFQRLNASEKRTPTKKKPKLYSILEPAGLPQNLKIYFETILVDTAKRGIFSHVFVIVATSGLNDPITDLIRRWTSRTTVNIKERGEIIGHINSAMSRSNIKLQKVTSTQPSIGKSYWIRQQMRSANIKANPVLVSNSTTNDTFHESLKSIATGGKNMWLNLGVTCSKQTSVYLFKWLILRVSTHSNGAVIHLEDNTTIYLEVPVMRAKKSHSCNDLLQFVEEADWDRSLDVSPQNLDLCVTYKTKQPGKGLYGAQHARLEDVTATQNMIQYVCKTLNASMPRKQEPALERAFEESIFRPHTVADLTSQQCEETLSHYCRSERLMWISFVKFCFTQFRMFEESETFNPAKLREIHFSYPRNRRFAIQILVDCANAFTTASFDMENMEITSTWQDSLHPPLFFTHEKKEPFPLYYDNDPLFQKMAEKKHPSHKEGGGTPNHYYNILHMVTRDKSNFPDLRKLDRGEAGAVNMTYEVISQLFGVTVEKVKGEAEKDGFVITKDNLLKLVNIYFRIKSRLPLIIMGETGCGKTRLIDFMCGIMDGNSVKLDVHGGIKEDNIRDKIKEGKKFAENHPDKLTVVFFDEINTSSCVDMFKECLCDHTCDGEPLPENLSVIGACNPYRKRIGDDTEGGTPGLVFRYANTQENLFDDTDAELLTYLVYVIPPSMGMQIWDFGSLEQKDEVDYINSMITEINNRELQMNASEGSVKIKKVLIPDKHKLFCELIARSQYFMRKELGDPSCVSLRDVKRCINLERWFYSMSSYRLDYYRKEVEAGKMKAPAGSSTSDLRQVIEKDAHCPFFPSEELSPREISMALALCCCYYFRLSTRKTMSALFQGETQRERYLNYILFDSKYLIGKEFRVKTFDGPKKAFFMKYGRFNETLRLEKELFLKNMKFGDEVVSRNEALTENIFVMAVSIFNKLPALIVGKPGTSKSFAVSILKKTFSSGQRESLFSKFPKLEFKSMQCSPLTKPGEIKAAHDRAIDEEKKRNAQEKSRESHEGNAQGKDEAGFSANIQIVLLLDEVGLAEQSPHLPLKVLHQLFEPPELSVIGISNWRLDASKTNRMLLLNRQDPSFEELNKTASDIMEPLFKKMEEKSTATEKSEQPGTRKTQWLMPKDPKIRARVVNSITRVYEDIYTSHQPIAKETRHLHANTAGNKGKKEDYYGMRDFYNLIKCIGEHLDEELTVTLTQALSRSLNGYSRLSLAEKNKVCRGRLGVPLEPPKPTVELISLNLSDPKSRHLMIITENNFALQYMLDNKTIEYQNTMIFYCADYSDSRDERSTAKLLNNIRYCMENGNLIVMVGQNHVYELLYDLLNLHYTKIGERTLCHVPLALYADDMYVVHPDFKCIVVATSEEAYSHPPQGLPTPFLNRFEKQYLTVDEVLEEALDKTTLERIKELLHKLLGDEGSGLAEQERFSKIFAAYHDSLIASAILQAKSSTGSNSVDELVGETFRHLLWLAKPEWVLRIAPDQTLCDVNIHQEYLEVQSHTNLFDFVRHANKNGWNSPGIPEFPLGLHLSVWTHTRFIGISDLQEKFTHGLGANDVIYMNLYQITSERELENNLVHFFEIDNEAYLIVSFTDGLCSVDRLNHFNFLYTRMQFEFRFHPYQKHAIVIHHLMREHVELIHNQEEAYHNLHRQTTGHVKPLFDRLWHATYLDSIFEEGDTFLTNAIQLLEPDFISRCRPSLTVMKDLTAKALNKHERIFTDFRPYAQNLKGMIKDEREFNQQAFEKISERIRDGLQSRQGFLNLASAFWSEEITIRRQPTQPKNPSSTYEYVDKYITFLDAFLESYADWIADELMWLFLSATGVGSRQLEHHGLYCEEPQHLSSFVDVDKELFKSITEYFPAQPSAPQ